MDDTFAMIAAERRALADEMAGFTDEQWRTPSLCGRWTVRQVAGHLVTPFTVSTPRFLGGLVASGFRFDRANDRFARAAAAAPADELVATLRRNADSRFTPPGFGPEAPLTDIIVHGQDVRRPLGLPHHLAPDHLLLALDFVAGGAIGFAPKGRVAGLRVEATDLDWAIGPADAPVVAGPAEALLLAVTGRAVALADLDGDGVDRLRARLA